MSKYRKSIFTVLLVRIIIVVVLINVGMASLQIYETVKLQKTNEEITRAKIQSEITGLLDTWKVILESMDQGFGQILENTSEKIVNLQERSDLGNINLHEQLELLGLDTSNMEIRIIEDGTIINSIYKQEMGLNIYELDINHKKRLLEVLENGNFFKEWLFSYRIVNGNSYQPRFQCISYQPTKDKKYIVELGSYSETADELITMFSDRITRIKRDNDDVLFVNLHITDYLSFLKDTTIYALHDSMVNRAFNQKENISEQFTQSDRKLIADYIYYELGDRDKNWNWKQSVFSIITDITDHRMEVYRIITKQIIIILCFLILLSGMLVIATRNLKITLKDMLLKTTVIANGNLKERVIVTGQNEFTTLAEQFNTMVQKLESSQNDLKQKKKEIEKSHQMLKEQNEEITSQSELVNQQNVKISDSIQYAKKIQSAVLPHQAYIDEILPENFILFKPRDVVSGDFYWVKQISGFIVIAAADCTGHGVPGAILSMLGISFLNEIVQKREITEANQVLNELRKQIKQALRQTGKKGEADDGMDISLCVLETKTKKLQYAGANNPLYLIQNNELTEIKADRMPIGYYPNEKQSFTNHEIQLKNGDIFYLFSDGYMDQFGGKKGFKYKSSNFQKILTENHNKPMIIQKELLEQELKNWMKGHEQTDDILVMGVRV